MHIHTLKIGQGVAQVVIQADDAFEVDGLAGAVNRALGVDVAGGLIGFQVKIGVDAEIVGADAFIPIANGQTKNVIARFTNN